MTNLIDNLVLDFISNTSEATDSSGLTEGLSLGIVVDNDDPLQQGRLRIFCPSLSDDPKKLLHLPWCSYVSPVAGAIDNNEYVRGVIPGNDKTIGPVHYGFWAIPEIGAHALVACVNGDPRRRVWLGCLPSHQETNTMGVGRYRHGAERGGNNVDGPLSSNGGDIQPTADKLQEAFNRDLSASEWKSRGADYQISMVDAPPRPGADNRVDSKFNEIQDNEQDTWVKELLGAHGYDWTGYKNLGSFLASRVYAWTTPGFHSITMDDRAFNSRVRFRTTGGHQIIMDDTNERIYVAVGGGKTWLEMDSSGNMDIFAERRLSIHSEKDMNFSSDESIRFKAGTYISMYAGDERGQDVLPADVDPGEIRFHATNEMHIKADTDFRLHVQGNTFQQHDGNIDIKGQKKYNLEVQETLYTESVTANIKFQAVNVEFKVDGKDTGVAQHIAFNDELVGEINAFVAVYNTHTHPHSHGPGITSIPMQNAQNHTEINDEGFNDNDPITPHETRKAPWTNRVPEHEPWPRVMKQDKDDPVNQFNDGYKNNVDWIDQFDNVGNAGRRDIGEVEGDERVPRGRFWRR